MQAPQKYHDDKVYLKLFATTIEDWKKLSPPNKQKRWYNASKYGDDNPLLAIGVIEKEVKDEFNEYARGLRCKNKEELSKLRTKRAISDPDVETLKIKIAELEEAREADNQSKDEIIEQLNDELAKAREAISKRDKQITAFERKLAEDSRGPLDDQLTAIRDDLGFIINNLVDKKDQVRSMLESINRRLGKLQLSHSS